MLTLFTPAVAFWGYGLLVWTWHTGWSQVLTQVQQLEDSNWWTLLVVGLFVVLLSSLLVQSLVLPALRLLEGYLPRWFWLARLRMPLVVWQHRHTTSLREQYNTIAEGAIDQPLTREQREEIIHLEQQLRQFPANPDDLMPTRLGNILRAAERRPTDKYGLDAIICWPRLWLLLPDTARQELGVARASLDMDIRIIIWGSLLFVWSFWAWWSVLVALLVVGFAYRRAIGAATVYGDLLEAAFDLYRLQLYDALSLPRPTSPAEEPAHGQRLTEYLYRGLADTSVRFVEGEE
jgi:hypothetical protein